MQLQDSHRFPKIDHRSSRSSQRCGMISYRANPAETTLPRFNPQTGEISNDNFGEITSGTDNQLTPMAAQAREATGIDELTVVADRGYFKGEQVRQCAQAGITPLVPKSLTSNSKADGRFDKQDFVYIAADDEYRCPAGQRAIKRFTTIEQGMTLNKYWSSACPSCALKAQCTTSDYRRITRWEHEAVLEAMQLRL